MNQKSPPQIWQNLFRTKGLPYGAQYEINRLVSIGKLKYEDISVESVNELAKMGTNREAAPATAKVMLKHSFEDDESDGMSISFLTDHWIIALSFKENMRLHLPRNVLRE